MGRHRGLSVGLVLLLFTVIGVVRHLDVPGEDLSSSYVGCQILAAGQGSHLYSHDTEEFNLEEDPVWTSIAEKAQFDGELHPYVQTPLWALGIRPLCTRMTFPAFNRFFLVVTMLCFAGTIWIVTRHWTPRLFHPGWTALICLGLYASQPFLYALFLSQTHILFLFMTVVALVWARERHPVAAGILLAMAAAVKITPAFLLIYWLLTRQRKAAWSFVLASAGLVGLTVLTEGAELMRAYVHELSEISNVLLVAFNNQSFAAWWMGHRHPSNELLFWHTFRLPTAMKTVSLLLCFAATIAGGLLDRVPEAKLGGTERPKLPPYGAVFAMVGATMFTPLAWSHYFIVLLVPMLLLMDAILRRRSADLAAIAVVVYGLNAYPLAFQAAAMEFPVWPMARSHFYAGLLTLAGLLVLSLRESRRERRGVSRESTGIRAGSLQARSHSSA